MNHQPGFSPRAFLRSRKAALVHFSTVMAGRLDLTFPNDLRQAKTMKGVPLSFSTILAGDTNPHMAGRGGAEGSVGLLVDIGPDTVINSVSPDDSGSNVDGSLGLDPTDENCKNSIDNRLTSNEWHVKDYVPVGIFLLAPIVVREVHEIGGALTPIEVKIGLETILMHFPGERVFSANERHSLSGIVLPANGKLSAMTTCC